MKRMSALRAWEAATEPDPAAVDRLRKRLAGPAVRGALRALAPVDDPAVDRLRARLASPRGQSRTARGRRWGAVVASVAIAAGVLLAPRLLPEASRSPALEEQLVASAQTERALTPAVGLTFQGSGSAEGPYLAPRVHWEAGVLRVEVDPTAGVDLVVETREASIRVVGTGFAVTRDALGTMVTVAHGAVAVSCGDGWTGTLHASEVHTCMPMTATGWLLRAQALRDQASADPAVLDAVARGLALAPRSDPAAAELLAVRIEVLAAAGRLPEARDAARTYPSDGPRVKELSHLLDSPAGP